MSELITIDAKSISHATYQIDIEQVKKTVASYALLDVSGPTDKSGMKAVREARLELRRIRTAIETRRKELKAGSLEYGRRVDEVAKELTSLVEPTETLLDEREKSVERELKRQAAERLQKRVDALRAVEADVPVAYLEGISDEEFQNILTLKTSEYQERRRLAKIAAKEAEKKAAEEAEARRVEQERIAAEKKAEAERLAAERKQLEEQQEKFRREQAERQRILEEQQAKIDAENARLDAERRLLEREAREKREREESEQRRLEAEEQARKAEADRVERERVLAAEREAAEKAEAERLERLRPDRDKILSLAIAIEKYELPILSDECGINLRSMFTEFAFDLRIATETL